MELFGTQKVNQEGILSIGGCLITDLTKTYGTPVYIMDEAHIRAQCQWFLNYFKAPNMQTEIIYASKAFLTLAMARLIDEEGLSLDVVSGGELYTARKVNFPMERVYFHGNNKSQSEIEMALSYGLGTIICDHEDEVDMLIDLIKPNQKVDVLLRINPGIEAHTHEYIKTTKNDSKFGVSIFDEKTIDIIRKINTHPRLEFLGFHSHIGSQIFEMHSFFDHASVVLTYVKKIKDILGIDVKHINLGGGFGVKYTEEDHPISKQTFLGELLSHIQKEVFRLNLLIPKISIEPGRAIVANAGTTLYEVATIKQTFGDKQYVFVDGSMADHIRTVLYQASYHAKLANRMHDADVSHYTVTGKACESGDIIIRDAFLPTPQKGDILAVFTTGAYHYTMASNYNRLTKPAVIFVKDGQSKVVVKRETYEDLLRNDCLDGVCL